MRYAWIKEQTGRYPVSILCKSLSVSRSGYYGWLHQKVSSQSIRRQAILDAAQKSYWSSKGIYGYRKVHKDLTEREDLKCCRETVRRILAFAGLQSKLKRRHRYPAKSNQAVLAAPNQLDRDFSASGPNQKWVSDITYISTREGWIYLAIVLDIFSRRVVGWAMSENVDARLACDALGMAIKSRCPNPGLIHHSDQGSQYTSDIYRDTLRRHGILCSMSRKGNCWDNAVAETFFSKLKREWVNWSSYKTRSEARSDIFLYLEGFYNRSRRHAGIGYLSPVDFESAYQANNNLVA